MSTFVVKLCYNQAVKKVQLTKDQLNWDHVCSIITKSFYLPEKNKIKLKYQDLENDEITVSSDEDLVEALNMYSVQRLVKFFVHYSGTMSQGENQQNTGYSKVSRPKSMCVTSQDIQKIVNKEIPKEIIEISTGNKTNEEIAAIKPKVATVKIDSNELQEIFKELFAMEDVARKVQEKLQKHIPTEDKNAVEYKIETDCQAAANYLLSNLTEIMNKKMENSIKGANSVNIRNPDKEEEPIKKNSCNKKGILDVSLRESIYENSSQDPLCVTNKEKDLITSFSSSMGSRNLQSTMGVKLAVKYENGKARFVSIPANEYSIIDENPAEILEKSNGFSFINKEQRGEEVKKIADKEKNAPEFMKNMLKANIHDLDDDLPAPYNKEVVKKTGKGMQESVYEKIY